MGTRKWTPFVLGCVASLLATVLASPPLAWADKALTDAQIAEANKPGTIMIFTRWTNAVSFPREQQRWPELIEYAKNQAALGLIQNNPHAMFNAMFDELLRHPMNYLVPAGSIGGECLAAVSGSGFIVTPDGYIVTNEHVVYPDERDQRAYCVQQWNQTLPDESGRIVHLKDLFNADFASFQKLYKKYVGTDVTPEIEQRFIVAEQQFYLNYMKIEKTNTEVFALMGVAIPGLPTQPKGIPCDIRKHGKVTPGKDVAILKIEENNLPTVPVGDDTKMNVGDHVLVLGYPGAAEVASQPMGVESTLTQGDLSARKTMPGGWSALQTSAEINHGNSGGPAFNDKGEVIGIATFGPQDAEAKGINFLVPMSVAREFLDELSIKPHQSRLSELYQQGVAEFNNHCYKKALESFKEVGDLNPGFPFVQGKITQSRVAIDQGLDRCWWNASYIVAGLVALIIVLTAVWLLTRRRTITLEPAPAGMPAGAGPMNTRVEQGSAPAVLPGPPAATLPEHSFGSIQGTSGAMQGRRFPVTKQGLLIGRDSSKCQIVLNDDAVSKEHAWVVPLDDGVVVIDRGSTNGVFVNSTDSPRVSKVRLQHGDKIFIGKGVAVFTYLSS